MRTLKPNPPSWDTIAQKTQEAQQNNLDKTIEFFTLPSVVEAIKQFLLTAAQRGSNYVKFTLADLQPSVGPQFKLVISDRQCTNILNKLYPGYYIEVLQLDTLLEPDTCSFTFRW